MADEKKPTEEQKQAEVKPELKEQSEQKPTDEKPAEPQKEENGEGEKPEEAPEEKPKENEPQEAAPPELSETDKLKEENFRLKTQLEAMKVGFNPTVIEDAVVLAENIVKRDGVDIAEALKAVSKKYPDWKVDTGKEKGGFKIGADSTGTKPTSDDKLKKAFGIKKG